MWPNVGPKTRRAVNDLLSNLFLLLRFLTAGVQKLINVGFLLFLSGLFPFIYNATTCKNPLVTAFSRFVFVGVPFVTASTMVCQSGTFH